MDRLAMARRLTAMARRLVAYERTRDFLKRIKSTGRLGERILSNGDIAVISEFLKSMDGEDADLKRKMAVYFIGHGWIDVGTERGRNDFRLACDYMTDDFTYGEFNCDGFERVFRTEDDFRRVCGMAGYVESIPDWRRRPAAATFIMRGWMDWRNPEDRGLFDAYCDFMHDNNGYMGAKYSTARLIRSHEDLERVAERQREDVASRESFDPDAEFGSGVRVGGTTLYALSRNGESFADLLKVRRALDAAYGRNFDPWCLIARDEGRMNDGWFKEGDGPEAGIPDELAKAWSDWKGYGLSPKRIAYRGGKPIAFFANWKWWNLDDRAMEYGRCPGVEKDDIGFYLDAIRDREGDTASLKTLSVVRWLPQEIRDRLDEALHGRGRTAHERARDFLRRVESSGTLNGRKLDQERLSSLREFFRGLDGDVLARKMAAHFIGHGWMDWNDADDVRRFGLIRRMASECRQFDDARGYDFESEIRSREDFMGASDSQEEDESRRVAFDPEKEFGPGRRVGNAVFYAVSDYGDNDPERFLAVRRAIDAAYGWKRNPWCVIKRDRSQVAGRPADLDALDVRRDGIPPELQEAWLQWRSYDDSPRRLAYAGGRPVAFFADWQWWNMEDESYDIGEFPLFGEDPAFMEEAVTSGDSHLKLGIAACPGTPREILARLADDADPAVRNEVFDNPNCGEEAFMTLADCRHPEDDGIRIRLISDGLLSDGVLLKMASRCGRKVLEAMLESDGLSDAVRRAAGRRMA